MVCTERNADRAQPRTFAWFGRAELRLEPESARTLARRAVEQRRRRHVRRQSPHRRELVEHVETRSTRQAVSADGDTDARGVEGFEGRRSSARVAVAPGTRDER